MLIVCRRKYHSSLLRFRLLFVNYLFIPTKEQEYIKLLPNRCFFLLVANVDCYPYHCRRRCSTRQLVCRYSTVNGSFAQQICPFVIIHNTRFVLHVVLPPVLFWFAAVCLSGIIIHVTANMQIWRRKTTIRWYFVLRISLRSSMLFCIKNTVVFSLFFSHFCTTV